MRVENLDPIRQAAIETQSRAIRISNLEVLHYRPDLETSKMLLTQQGTATLFFAKKGDAFLDKIYQSLKKKGGADRSITDKFAKQFDGLDEMSLEEAAQVHKKQHVLASLRYGGKTLVEGIFTPDKVSVGAVAMPYNGGQLLKSGFQLVEHLKEGTAEALQGFIVIHEPPLTKAEKDILKKLPADQLELNVGTCPVGFAPALIAIAVAICLATGICCPQRNEDFVIPQYALDPYDIHLSDQVISRISAAAAAAEILKIRRNFLEHEY
jgi:hypothetical protein